MQLCVAGEFTSDAGLSCFGDGITEPSIGFILEREVAVENLCGVGSLVAAGRRAGPDARPRSPVATGVANAASPAVLFMEVEIT